MPLPTPNKNCGFNSSKVQFEQFGIWSTISVLQVSIPVRYNLNYFASNADACQYSVSIPVRYNLNPKIALTWLANKLGFNSSKVQFEHLCIGFKDESLTVSIPVRYNLNCFLLPSAVSLHRFNSSKVQFEQFRKRNGKNIIQVSIPVRYNLNKTMLLISCPFLKFQFQ